MFSRLATVLQELSGEEGQDGDPQSQVSVQPVTLNIKKSFPAWIKAGADLMNKQLYLSVIL